MAQLTWAKAPSEGAVRAAFNQRPLAGARIVVRNSLEPEERNEPPGRSAADLVKVAKYRLSTASANRPTNAKRLKRARPGPTGVRAIEEGEERGPVKEATA